MDCIAIAEAAHCTVQRHHVGEAPGVKLGSGPSSRLAMLELKSSSAASLS